jgi:hypothetical protein
VSLSLPPRRLIRPGDESAALVHRELTSVVAYHPGALTTYLFYEELDAWLGPWGTTGYPLAYGKFYNIAFSSNEKLMADPVTKAWLRRTTILLQELLRDFVVGKVRDGGILTLTEEQLRAAAFDSHPRAYTEAGLATVALAAPELIPIIATIPGAEFNPTGPNFNPTMRQVFTTLNMVAPQVIGGGLAAAAGPAHTGLFRTAMRRDQRQLLNEMALGRELYALKMQINRGEVDDLRALNAIIDRLNMREFPDEGFTRLAREVVEAARQRHRLLSQNYRQLLELSPPVRRRIEQRFPEVAPPVRQ